AGYFLIFSFISKKIIFSCLNSSFKDTIIFGEFP
ncbi:MAG: hypothetical protein ACI82Z_001793, partial [Cellvibrionaceae bacterium]